MQHINKYLLFLLLSLMLTGQADAQVTSSTGPLRVGQKMPDIRLYHLLNYKDSTAKLSDFAGKAILLDFWAIWCTTCVEEFPVLQAAQDRYADLKILSVAYENTEGIRRFIDRVNKSTKFNITTATEDDANLENGDLLGYFPHSEVPLYIWIDKDRTIRGITGVEALNDSNFALLVAGKDIVVPKK